MYRYRLNGVGGTHPHLSQPQVPAKDDWIWNFQQLLCLSQFETSVKRGNYEQDVGDSVVGIVTN